MIMHLYNFYLPNNSNYNIEINEIILAENLYIYQLLLIFIL